MRLLFINPNSTRQMTDSIVAAARAAVPGAQITGWTNADGPPAIQGPQDGAAATPGLLALLPDARAHGADVIVIGCFDDTGLEAARAAAHCPVIGIGQAACHMAALKAPRFSVVTTLPVSVPVLEGNIARLGFAGQCQTIHASGYSVLAVEEGAPDTIAALAADMRALHAAGAGAVVLGCAGMAAHADRLAALSGAPLVDGVRSAALLGQALALDARGDAAA